MWSESFSLSITRNDPLTFAIRTDGGQTPKICSVAVRELGANTPREDAVWFLIAAPDDDAIEWNDDGPIEPGGVTQPQRAFVLGEPIPLTEWSTDHPELVAGLEEMRREVEKVSIRIAELRYGEIPSGFRQLRPRYGNPKSLQPGRHYEIIVQGVGTSVGTGRLEFGTS